jgi:gliding motility-associated lipoprotein GldD
VFEVSKNAQINPYTKQNKPCWFDIRYHNLKATVHCSYDNIKGKNNQDYFEDARDLAYKHVVKSSGIKEYSITDFEQKVYGIIYEISGNTASSYQFYLTDSVNHFFRASLYYDDQVNLDSIAPVTDFLKKDINRITETFRWK